ncbi:MAG: segregation/condensation protein A [Polyangiaceae bacterium]
MTAGRARKTASGAAGPGLKRAVAPEASAPVAASAEAAKAPVVEYPSDAYCVSVPQFEGPLDLLLQLIQKHELHILDIPVGFVTEKYLEYLGIMRALTIDVASEYLVMAATLTHIKSKMLLPDVPKEGGDESAEEEEEDPRADLIRRLLEYQKYKAAAESLGSRETLGKDVFPRGASEPVPQGPAPFAPSTTFELLDAFSKILSRTKTKIEHEVVFDRISISDRIAELVDSLKERRSTPFEELFAKRTGEPPTRFDLIITFLAVLEMARLRMMRVYQADSLSQIHCELLVVEEEDASQDDSNGEGSGDPSNDAPAPRDVDAPALPEETITDDDPS